MTTAKSLKAAVVAEESVEPTTVTFDFDGVEYTVPSPKKWPIEVIEAQEDGRLAGAVAELLGAKQYKAFKKVPRTMEDLENLTEALFKAVETSVGE